MISSKILVPLVVTFACLLAIVVGVNLAMDSSQTITYVGGLAMVVTLILFARDYWWIALFVAVGFGGSAYFGFKLYTHETLLAIALAGLIPSIAMNPRSDLVGTRPKLPWFFYATSLYLGFHVVYSVTKSSPHDFIELGNILRAYTFGLWPLIFVFLFRWYGRSDYLPFAILLLQFVYLSRAILTICLMYFPATAMVPGIGFLLPGVGSSEEGGSFQDLRFTGHGICVISCAMLLSRPTFPVAAWQALLLIFSGSLLLLSGGRGMLVASIVAVLAAIAVGRMWKLLSTLGLAVTALVVLLNSFPRSIEGMDYRIQRALSVLIVDSGASYAGASLENSSDLWHDRIQKEGYDRWVASPKNFLIGTGIRPWDARASRETNPQLWLDVIVRTTADVGNYESALWAILAPTGLVGFSLYLLTIGYFAFSNGTRIVRENPRGIKLSIAFLGCYPALEWLLFSPVQGGYPQIEMLFAAAAFYYLGDHSASTESSTPVHEEESLYSNS